MIVEPFAGDTVADNLNPVGRVYYSFSTFLCVPNALSQQRRLRARRAGRRAADPAGRDRRGLHPVPPGRRDAVQHRVRGASVDSRALPYGDGSPAAGRVRGAGRAAGARRRGAAPALSGRRRRPAAGAHRLRPGRPVRPGHGRPVGRGGAAGARRAPAAAVRPGTRGAGPRQARPRADRGPADRLRGRVRRTARRRRGRRRARGGGGARRRRRRRSSGCGSSAWRRRPGAGRSGRWRCSSTRSARRRPGSSSRCPR